MTSIRPTDTAPLDAGERASHFVLGGERLGQAIAEQLDADGHTVTVVDETPRAGTVPGIEGSPTDVDILAESGLNGADVVIVGTQSDARNLLVAQLVRVHFDVGRIVVLVTDPERYPVLAEAGHEPLCVTTAVARAVTEQL